MGRFVEMCRKKGLKVNAGKIKEMVMNGEEAWSVRFTQVGFV